MHNLDDDIAKYNKGEMSPEEMHVLEKKALNDPFLADALDGISSISSDELKDDLRNLRGSLHQKINEKEKHGFNWQWSIRIAAGIILLAVCGYVLNSLFTTDTVEPKTLALNKQEEKLETPESQQSVVEEEIKSVETSASKTPTANQSFSIESQEEKRTAVKSDVKQKDFQDETVIANELKNKQTEISTTPERSSVAGAVQAPLQAETFKLEKADQAEAVASAPIENTLAKSRARKMAPAKESQGFVSPLAEVSQDEMISRKTIQGKVTDADDDLPIPGVNVLVKGTTIGTVTDLNGDYEISIPINQNDLIFSYIGMETKEVSSDKTDDVNVQLSADVSALSEVVVVGYGTEDETEFEGTRWELADPNGGRKEYKKYLEQSLTYPKLAMANDVEGKVTIQFTIQPSGQLTDFRVVRGLGYGCDEEVIRLIKEGPQWKPTKRNDEPVKGKGKVKMRFKLPEKITKDK